MEALCHFSSAAYPNPNLPNRKVAGSSSHSGIFNFPLHFSSSCCSPSSLNSRRSALIVRAKKKKDKKDDDHYFVPKPDEATGPFPESVLLRKKKVQEDGSVLPEFADAEEEKLYDFLNLELQSGLDVDRMRHYEVVYLIHEMYEEEVDKVNEKVQDFLREKKGKVWRMNDWGMRRLAYRIQKAWNAHYILMNFEMEAKWINEFKTLLDKDERVIRHLVIKRDKAITQDDPPPLEFHTLKQDASDEDDDEEEDEEGEYDDDDDDEEFDDDEDWDEEDDDDDEEEEEGDDEEAEDGVVIVNIDDDEGEGSGNGKKMKSANSIAESKGRNEVADKVRRANNSSFPATWDRCSTALSILISSAEKKQPLQHARASLSKTCFTCSAKNQSGLQFDTATCRFLKLLSINNPIFSGGGLLALRSSGFAKAPVLFGR